MSFLRLISALLVLGSVAPSAQARGIRIDAQACELTLSKAFLKSFVRAQGSRLMIYSTDGIALGNYIPDPADGTKLINLRGSNYPSLAAAVIRHLKFDQDLRQNKDLARIIEAVMNIAHEMPAAISISSFIKNGERNIRLSLDMNSQPTDRSPILRLPELEIANGTAGRRVDIDVTPDGVTLVVATTQTYYAEGQWLVGEPASHSMGLSIQGTATAPVIDTLGAKLRYFIGPKPFPQMPELLALAERLTRSLHPQARTVLLRYTSENAESTAVSEGMGNGWNLSN